MLDKEILTHQKNLECLSARRKNTKNGMSQKEQGFIGPFEH